MTTVALNVDAPEPKANALPSREAPAPKPIAAIEITLPLRCPAAPTATAPVQHQTIFAVCAPLSNTTSEVAAEAEVFLPQSKNPLCSEDIRRALPLPPLDELF